jgi:hypothetical protein
MLLVENDTSTLALFPLESMLEKIKMLQNNLMHVMEGNFEEKAGVVSRMLMKKNSFAEKKKAKTAPDKDGGNLFDEEIV